MVLITLLLDQVDFYAADGECVGLVVGVGEVGQRGTDDGDGGQRHAQEQSSDLLVHVIALLFVWFLGIRMCKGSLGYLLTSAQAAAAVAK